jgi:TatD DNase family protein
VAVLGAGTIPAEWLLLETDCPWCEIRPTHAGFKNVPTLCCATSLETYLGWGLIRLLPVHCLLSCESIHSLVLICAPEPADPAILFCDRTQSLSNGAISLHVFDAAQVVTTWPTVKKEKFEEGTMVKNRTEPAHMWAVLEVVAAVRGVSKTELAKQVLANSERLFFPVAPAH